MEKRFVENKRAYELYVKTPLLKALIKIIIPGLLISLMMGIYWFVDQILIARLVPHDGVHTCENIFGYSEETIKSWIKQVDPSLIFYGPGEVIKTAITISSPISLVLLCMPFFISTGTGIIFTQAIGKNNREKGYESYKMGFWTTTTIGLLMTFIFGVFCTQILTSMAGKEVVVKGEGDIVNKLNEYYHTVHTTQIKYAHDFIFILSLGPVLPCLINLFSVLIRAEGRLLFPTLISIAANIVNVLLDFLLIWYAKRGMQSGGIATFSGWVINLTALLCYIYYLNKKKKFTWIHFRTLSLFNNVKLNFKLYAPINLLGLSGFLTDFTYSIAMMVYLPILSQTCIDINVAGGGEYFMTISAGVLPIMNLLFATMWGIVDGSRPINSYNYAICNFKRIKKTYWYTIFISFTFALICFGFISGIRIQVLQLFEINKSMMHDAYIYLVIDLLLLPTFSFQVSGILLFQGTNNILRANIASILQDVIVYYPTLFILRLICVASDNIWILIPTYVISASISSILMTIYCSWYVNKRLGFTKIKAKINDKFMTFFVPTKIQKMSIAEKALDY